MRKLRSALQRRIWAAVAVLAATGLTGALATATLHRGAPHPLYRSPASALASGLPPVAGAKALVDKHGHAITDARGRRLFVDRHGHLLDATGHTVVDHGHAVTIGPHGHLPTSVLTRSGQREPAPGRSPAVHDKAPAPGDAGAPLVIGVPVQNPASEDKIYAQYGGKVETADDGVIAQSVAAWINAHGGIGGRRIRLRLFHYDLFDGRPYDAHYQEICDFFSSAPKPIAVIQPPRQGNLCTAQRGILTLSDGPTNETTSAENAAPSFYFEPSSLAPDRYATPYLEGLRSAGFFSGNARIGLIRALGFDDDGAMDRTIHAALARAGIRVAAEATIPPINAASDVPTVVSRLGDAVVRFRLAGVDHVISVDNNGVYMGLFMEAAEPQGYRPRYGLSSLNEPALLRASVSANQLRGAVGIGWSPLTDVGPGDDVPAAPERALCSRIFQSSGVRTGSRYNDGEFASYAICDDLLLLRDVRAAPGMDMRAALERLGSSRTSALDFATRLDGTYHDGAAGYRQLEFQDGCGCFRYSGPVEPLP